MSPASSRLVQALSQTCDFNRRIPDNQTGGQAGQSVFCVREAVLQERPTRIEVSIVVAPRLPNTADYRCTEQDLSVVGRLIRIAGTALADIIGPLLRLRTKSREDIRLVTHVPQFRDFIVEQEMRGSHTLYIPFAENASGR